MVRGLGHAVATRLGARALGVVGLAGQDPPQHDVGSAFRLAQVARSLTLREWSDQALEQLRDCVVVLVDPAEVGERSVGDLYVAMTRPTRRLRVVSRLTLPRGLEPRSGDR